MHRPPASDRTAAGPAAAGPAASSRALMHRGPLTERRCARVATCRRKLGLARRWRDRGARRRWTGRALGGHGGGQGPHHQNRTPGRGSGLQSRSQRHGHGGGTRTPLGSRAERPRIYPACALAVPAGVGVFKLPDLAVNLMIIVRVGPLKSVVVTVFDLESKASTGSARRRARVCGSSAAASNKRFRLVPARDQQTRASRAASGQ